MADLKIPGGKEKGALLTEATDESLKYWCDRISGELAQNKVEQRFVASNMRLVEGMRAEMARRAGGGQRAAAPSKGPANTAAAGSQLMTKAQALALCGAFSDMKEAMEVMRQASEVAHLVTPQTSVPNLPLGCQLVFSIVWVDAETETYGIPTKDSDERGLDKNALAKIAAAAGISWDPELSRRLDNGRDPHYVHFRAVGLIRNFDGTLRTESGEVEYDLRENTTEALEAHAKADKQDIDAKNGHGKPAKRSASGLPSELALKRQFILRHAESKARNRVVRNLGVKTKYHRSDLSKPFVIAKVMFTGHTPDPALQRVFAEKIADSFLESRATLYSGRAHPTPALPAQREQPREQPHDPPPVGSSPGDPTDDDNWMAFGSEDERDEALRNIVNSDSVPKDAVPASSKAAPKQEDLPT